MAPEDINSYSYKGDKDQEPTLGDWLTETFKSKEAREVLVKGYPWIIAWVLAFIFIIFAGGIFDALIFALISLVLTSIVTGVLLGYKKLKKWSESGERKYNDRY